MNVTFTVYPSGTPPIRFQWRFNDTNLSGATNSSLVLSNVQWTNAGAYSVVLSNSVGQATSSNALLVLGSIATWGATPNPPLNLTNATALSGWNQHYLALQPDGTVRAWGRNDNGQTDVPAGLSNVIAVCTSDATSYALKADGTVVGWGAGATNTGFPNVGQLMYPPGLTNIIALAGGAWHCLALKRDGTVVAWGYNGYGQTDVPSSATNVVVLAGGWGHSLALRADGRVIAWGAGTTGSGSYGQAMVPGGLSDVVAISANGYHSLAVKSDGHVVAWGAGKINTGSFPDFGQSIVSASLTNVIAVGAGFFSSYALKQDGKVVNCDGSAATDPGLGGLTALEGSSYGGMALQANALPFFTAPPFSQTVPLGSLVYFPAKATGRFRWPGAGNSTAPMRPTPPTVFSG